MRGASGSDGTRAASNNQISLLFAVILVLAERVGFEPTCRLPDKTLSRRPRYDHFGTSPVGRSARDGPFIIASATRDASRPFTAPGHRVSTLPRSTRTWHETGEFHELWEGSSLRADGMITALRVEVAMMCSDGAASGSFSGNWDVRTWTFNGGNHPEA